jgi:siroheme synthase
VTLRGVASEIIVRSGHHLSSADPASEGKPAPTHIYFMAATRLAEVARELLSEGIPPSTPAAVISRGTLPDQRVIQTTVGALAGAAERGEIETPALVVAGEVVRFRDPTELLPLIERQLIDQESHS